MNKLKKDQYSSKNILLKITYITVILGGLTMILAVESEQPMSSVYWAFFTALIVASIGTLVLTRIWFESVKKYPKAHWRRVAIVIFELLGLIVCLFIGGVAYLSNASGYLQEQTRQEQEIQQQEKNVQRSAITTDGLYLSVNKTRANYGAQALESNSLLNSSAQMQCDDMSTNNYFANINPVTGKNGWEYVKDAGTANYNYALTSSYSGVYYSADEVIDSWTTSEASKAAMIDAKYNQVGFAKCHVAQLGDQDVYVMHLLQKYVAPNVIYQQATPSYTPRYTPPSTYRCSEDYYGTGMTCRSSF